MLNTVSAYMATNNSIWGSVPAITATVAEVNANIAKINDKMGRQQTPTTGATDEKTQVRGDFEDQILLIADQLSSLADKNKDKNLGAQVDLNISTLDKLSDDELEETGRRISALATANLGALAAYGIVQADLAALDALVTKFHGVKAAPRTVIAGRKGETDTIPDLIRDTKSLLRNQLDKQMTRFKKLQPEFFAGYRAARVIVDRGGSGGGSPRHPLRRPPHRSNFAEESVSCGWNRLEPVLLDGAPLRAARLLAARAVPTEPRNFFGA